MQMHSSSNWTCDVQFDDFVASEPTAQPMMDDDIVNLVCTENDVPQEESEDEDEEIPSAKLNKSTTEFLAIVNQLMY